MASITLRPEARDAILEGSPWVRREEIARLEGAPSLGDAVSVRDHHGDFLGSGLYAPGARIPIRIMSRDPEERLDGGAIHRRIARAIELRRERFGLPDEAEQSFRLIHGEADALPGLFVDRFGDVALLRITCPGLGRYEDDLIGAIARALPGGAIYGALRASGRERSDARGDSTLRLLRGEERDNLSFVECGARLEIPLELFEASGFSLAHRVIRRDLARLARDGELLEVGAAGSACALSALQNGARSATAIEPAPLLAASIRASAERLGVSDRLELLAQRGPSALKSLQSAGRRFDALCLLPGMPRRSRQTRESASEKASLMQLLRLGLRLLRDEGTLILGGPLGARSEGALDELLMHAARMESRQAIIFERATAGPDYPSLVGFHEAPVVEALYAIVRRRRPIHP